MKIIYKDGHVDECPQDQELHVIRHTAAHIMAQAIKRLYPEADFAFGPATENGFYYDVDLGDTKLTDDDLANIEKEMRKICKENLAIKPFILPRDEAVKLMEERQEHYKIEHMADLADETEFSFFQQGEYVDMCIGPHLTYTKALKAFKITQQSGAYWKNDKENKMLTRINGVAFHNQEELEAWEKEQQEARERDHRKIGKEMGLFMTDDLVGRGLPMFLPAKFHLTYVDKDGTEKTPVVLHRAILGSLDRFMAYLIEETKGKFPTWLAPTQVKVLPVSEKTLEYAQDVTEKLADAGVRVVLDDDNQKIGYKIRAAQQVDRVPYMLVLGAKEAEAGNISVRDRKGETTTMELDAFIAKVTAEIRNRSL